MAGFNTALQAATPGMSKLAMALGGGGRGAYQQGYDNEMGLQSKLAQALAATRAHDASAELSLAKAANERAAGEARAPDALLRTAMTSQGVPLGEEQAVGQFRDTGRLGGAYAPAADGMGPVAPEPAWASRLPAVLEQVAGVQRALTLGDKNSAHVAQAAAIERGTRLGDAILAGTMDRNKVAGAQAAIEGKPMFHAGADGGVLDQFAGTLDAANPLAQSTIGLRGAQAGQAQAAAANQRAHAGLASAQTEKVRDEVKQGGKGRYDADRGVMIMPDGTATPVTVNGQPLPPKSRGGPMSAALQKELLESDDLVQSTKNTIRTLEEAKKINSQAYSGYGAKQRATLASNIPGMNTPGADATILLDNMMTGQTLESLKSIFGGAPTEGERAILLDIQASANKTPKQREAIMDRAIAAAQRRGVYATNKAAAIRSGKYLSEGFSPDGPPAAPAPGGATGGWSITPE